MFNILAKSLHTAARFDRSSSTDRPKGGVPEDRLVRLRAPLSGTKDSALDGLVVSVGRKR